MESERELGMQRKHRQHIMKNMKDLIECTNYEQLAAQTVQSGLFSQVMRNNIEELNGQQHNLTDDEALYLIHKRYFEKITKRGPNAYEELKAILRSLQHVEALRILEGVDSLNSSSSFLSLSQLNSNKSADIVDTRVRDLPGQGTSLNREREEHNDEDGELRPYTAAVRGTREVLKSKRIHTDNTLETYTMKSHNRGVLLLVNLIDFPDVAKKRHGAEGDGESLIHIFREIGFTIFSYTNVHQNEFFRKLKALTDSHYVRDTECFVLVLMTHGERLSEMDKVQFSDGSYGNVKKIINHFQPDICPNLVNKPKVLIFPFCRGERPDRGKALPTGHNLMFRAPPQTDGVSYENVPTLSDILVCYASTPGYETHRDPKEGSWYIQKFCDMMAEHAHDTPLEDILKKTQAKVANMRTANDNLQTGAFDNLGFNKKLYFNPGYVEQSQ